MKKIITLALILLLVSCATQQQLHTIQTPFDEDEMIRLSQPGKNTIKGSALVRQNNGGVVTCAGSPTNLIPVMKYSTERMYWVYKNSTKGFYRVVMMPTKMYTNENPRYGELARRTMCDAQGFFKFENIADGDYFLTTNIIWNTGGNSVTKEGGFLMLRVSVKDGETKEVVLSP